MLLIVLKNVYQTIFNTVFRVYVLFNVFQKSSPLFSKFEYILSNVYHSNYWFIFKVLFLFFFNFRKKLYLQFYLFLTLHFQSFSMPFYSFHVSIDCSSNKNLQEHQSSSASLTTATPSFISIEPLSIPLDGVAADFFLLLWKMCGTQAAIFMFICRYNRLCFTWCRSVFSSRSLRLR